MCNVKAFDMFFYTIKWILCKNNSNNDTVKITNKSKIRFKIVNPQEIYYP